jgi:hypothetical protein
MIILKCIAPKPQPGALHLGMNQKTDILEEVPNYHKTRSAMHLFLTPHQRVQRTFWTCGQWMYYSIWMICNFP